MRVVWREAHRHTHAINLGNSEVEEAVLSGGDTAFSHLRPVSQILGPTVLIPPDETELHQGWAGTIALLERLSAMFPAQFAPAGIEWSDALLRIALSLLLALAMGLERFLRRKPFDFRPFVIISLASCALALGLLELGARSTLDTLSIDPAKVISGVMTGIGFLGAGALFRERNAVQGAGSAAAIWAAGAIGILCGLGILWLAILTALGIVALFLIGNRFTDPYQASLKDRDKE